MFFGKKFIPVIYYPLVPDRNKNCGPDGIKNGGTF